MALMSVCALQRWVVKNNGTARWPEGARLEFVVPTGDQSALFVPRQTGPAGDERCPTEVRLLPVTGGLV